MIIQVIMYPPGPGLNGQHVRQVRMLATRPPIVILGIITLETESRRDSFNRQTLIG